MFRKIRGTSVQAGQVLGSSWRPCLVVLAEEGVGNSLQLSGRPTAVLTRQRFKTFFVSMLSLQDQKANYRPVTS